MTDVLEAAEKLFQERGYHTVALADVAAEANIALSALQSQYPEKQDILFALLDRHNPRKAFQKALKQARANTAEALVRETFTHLMAVLDEHPAFLDYALLDIQMNSAGYLTSLFVEMAGDATRFINRLSKMPDVRPVSSVMLGRAFAAFVIGFLATERFAPRPAQFAMRLFPPRAWMDGMIDIFLYGILETE